MASGTVNESDIDAVVTTMLRTKFALGLFEGEATLQLQPISLLMTCKSDPYPYSDYNATLRTEATRNILHQMEQEAIVLLENRNGTLPLSTSNDLKVAVIGPQSDRVSASHINPKLSGQLNANINH